MTCFYWCHPSDDNTLNTCTVRKLPINVTWNSSLKVVVLLASIVHLSKVYSLYIYVKSYTSYPWSMSCLSVCVCFCYNFCLQSDFANFKVDDPSLSVVCVSPASDSSQTITLTVIIIKLGTVTASDMLILVILIRNSNSTPHVNYIDLYLHSGLRKKSRSQRS